jgi:hypothetical protein
MRSLVSDQRMWMQRGRALPTCVAAPWTRQERPCKMRVLDGGERCEINGYQLPCDHIGGHVRDALQVLFDNSITVLTDRTQQSEARVKRAREPIRIPDPAEDGDVG